MDLAMQDAHGAEILADPLETDGNAHYALPRKTK